MQQQQQHLRQEEEFCLERIGVLLVRVEDGGQEEEQQEEREEGGKQAQDGRGTAKEDRTRGLSKYINCVCLFVNVELLGGTLVWVLGMLLRDKHQKFS